MPSIQDYLKYANLQMAAEAFLVDGFGVPLTGARYIEALQIGNKHASVFTETQAEEFTNAAKGWTVLNQIANTPSGFSGTLFKNNATGELVISFRSTEFVDDAVRDSLATNTLEIFDTGFAWGQMADMEAWYANFGASVWKDAVDTSPISSIQFSNGQTMSVADAIAAVGIDLPTGASLEHSIKKVGVGRMAANDGTWRCVA